MLPRVPSLSFQLLFSLRKQPPQSSPYSSRLDSRTANSLEFSRKWHVAFSRVCQPRQSDLYDPVPSINLTATIGSQEGDSFFKQGHQPWGG